VAVSGDLDGSFQRTLTLHADRPVEQLWFRAWLGTKLEPQGDGSFLADGRIRLRFTLTDTSTPTIRRSDGKSELLVPVAFQGNKAVIVEQIVW
jgi:hypothetical protein